MNKSEFEGFTSTPKRTKKPQLVVGILLSFLFLAATFIGTCKLIEFFINNPGGSEASTFPKMEISLTGVPIEKIDAEGKDIKYPNNTVTITTKDSSITYEDVEIKGRGNTTWQQIKKSYQIKFKNSEPLLNLKPNKKWILLANFTDPSFLRNSTAFYLKKLLTMDSFSEGFFVELFVDGNYRGLYYLTDKIELGKTRVDMDDKYGVLVELDNLYGLSSECYYDKYDEMQNCLVAKEVVNEDEKDSSMKKFLYSFNLFLNALKQKKYREVEKQIDVESFAKYYLLNEFAANPDAYCTSFFMHKNGDTDKIHAGPGWDFDLSFGIEKDDDSIIYSPDEDMALKKLLGKSGDAAYLNLSTTIVYDLMEFPEFEAKVKEIYRNTMAGKKEEILNYIREQAEYIRPAATRDFERWKYDTTFDEEIDRLLDWVSKRYDHFEEAYTQASEAESTEES